MNPPREVVTLIRSTSSHHVTFSRFCWPPGCHGCHDGEVLAGHGNRKQKYYRLPAQAQCAPDYYLSESLLGRVRMQPVERVKGRLVSRMYKEKFASDKVDLLALHNRSG